MRRRVTDTQMDRLQAARVSQQESRERVKSMATSSITNWIISLLRPIVGRVVRAVVNWFANLFK